MSLILAVVLLAASVQANPNGSPTCYPSRPGHLHNGKTISYQSKESIPYDISVNYVGQDEKYKISIKLKQGVQEKSFKGILINGNSDWDWLSYDQDNYHELPDCRAMTHSNRDVKSLPAEFEFKRNDDVSQPLDINMIIVKDLHTFWKWEGQAEALESSSSSNQGILANLMSLFG